MAKFYTSVKRRGNYMLWNGYDNGRRFSRKEKFEPTFYMPTRGDEYDVVDLYDKSPLKAHKLESMSEGREFLERYKDVSGLKVHGTSNYVIQFIQEKYPGIIDFDLSKINIASYDIEVDISEKLPDMSIADNEITSISYKSSRTNKYHLLGRKDYDPQKTLIEGIDPDDILFEKFDTERALLRRFLQIWVNDYPDVVTGWNCIPLGQSVWGKDRIYKIEDCPEELFASHKVRSSPVSKKSKHVIRLANGSKVYSSADHIYFVKERGVGEVREVKASEIMSLDKPHVPIHYRANEREWNDAYDYAAIHGLASVAKIDVPSVSELSFGQFKVFFASYFDKFDGGEGYDFDGINELLQWNGCVLEHGGEAGYMLIPTLPYEHWVPVTSVIDTGEMVDMMDIETDDHSFVSMGVKVHNCKFFDIPYTVRRIMRVLGEDKAKELSPWGYLDVKTETMFGRDQDTFEIAGMTVIDLLDAFKKFGYKYGKQETYKLDHIAMVVLGEKKIDYSEYGSLTDLYEKNPQLYLDYSLKDTVLLQRIEDETGLIALVAQVAYGVGINLDDTYGTVTPWESLLYRWQMERGMCPPVKTGPGEMTGELVGGYVKDPVIGFSEWVVSGDLNSLYPMLMVFLNLSPETYRPDERIFCTPDLILDGGYVNENPDLIRAANGVAYDNKERGMIPTIIKEFYARRKTAKKEMLAAESRLEAIKNEMKRRKEAA